MKIDGTGLSCLKEKLPKLRNAKIKERISVDSQVRKLMKNVNFEQKLNGQEVQKTSGSVDDFCIFNEIYVFTSQRNLSIFKISIKFSCNKKLKLWRPLLLASLVESNSSNIDIFYWLTV